MRILAGVGGQQKGNEMKRKGLRQLMILNWVVLTGRFKITEMSFGRCGWANTDNFKDDEIAQAFKFVGKVKKAKRIKRKTFWGD